MSDLIKRLREGASFYHAPTTWNEAADRISALEKEKSVLIDAMQKILRRSSSHEHDTDADRNRDLYHCASIAEDMIRRHSSKEST